MVTWLFSDAYILTGASYIMHTYIDIYTYIIDVVFTLELLQLKMSKGFSGYYSIRV